MKQRAKDPRSRYEAAGGMYGKRIAPPKGLLVKSPPREAGSGPLYRAVYVIDVNAPNPKRAAECAYGIMSDPVSMRPMLSILDGKGRETVVDLADELSGTEIPGPSDTSRKRARRFVASAGMQCPTCGGRDIDYDTVEVDAQSAYQEACCQNCEARFCAIYRLVGYGLHGDDSFEVHTLTENVGEIGDDRS